MIINHIAIIAAEAGFKRVKCFTDHFGEGIHAYFGYNKNQKRKLQRIEFDASEYTINNVNEVLSASGRKPKGIIEGISFDDDIEINGAVDADVKIEAEHNSLNKPTTDNDGDGKPDPLPKFKMNAYNGGIMLTSTIPAPLIIDLSGVDTRNNMKIPIFLDHKTTQRVGHSTNITVTADNIMASGIVSAGTKFSNEVVESSANDYPWQASVGATIVKAKFISKKQSEVVNGQNVKGPLLIVQKSVLREISFVSIGADDTTSAVAASSAMAKGSTMFDKWLKANGFDKDDLDEKQLKVLKASYESEMNGDDGDDGDTVEPKIVNATNGEELAALAVKSERERIAGIRAACGGEFAEIQAKAEDEGWDVDKVNSTILKAMRDSRPNINTGVTGSDKDGAKVIEAALCIRAGLDDSELAKEYGEDVVNAAYKERGMALRDVMACAMRSEGVTVPRTLNNDFIRAAFSTASLPGILGNVANKSMLKSYNLQNITATTVCSSGDLSDFKTATRYRLNEIGDYSEIPVSGEIKHGTLSEESATNKLKSYGKMITLTREMIINDDLSTLSRIPASIGARAAQKIDEVFYTRLLANPNFPSSDALFSAANSNYQSGANTALDATAMNNALQLFMDQTNDDGLPINVMARFLLVPTSLDFIARQLLNSATLAATGSTDAVNIATANPLTSKNLQIVTSPFLNSSALTGNSALGWYLFGDPAIVDTFEIGYLRGQRNPVLERVDLPSNVLGMGWRSYFDFGIKEQDHRGMVFSKGEA